MSIRAERVASLIRHEIATMVSREYSDPGLGFITVTDVRVTPDLRIARISFSILGDQKLKEETMKMLNGEKTRIKNVLGPRLQLKFIPTLEFSLDDTLERVERINTLIKKIHDEKDHAEHD